jgi:serine/threonine protein kinase
MTNIQQNTEIDGYCLQEKLGSGTFGEVWRSKDIHGASWALKIYAAKTGLDDYTRNIFREEYEKTVNLDHPNVLRCIGYGEYEGRPYLILPLGQGNLLDELRKRMAAARLHPKAADFYYSEMEIAHILADVADGLVFLQDRGIMHQDIKPANILMMEIKGQTRYVIADFGVSTQLRSNILRQTEPLYRSEQGFAPGYASPEQLNGQVGKKSDIFSLGVMLYELASGKLPFESTGMSAGQAVSANYKPNALSEEFTLRFHNLILKCLEKEPANRPTAMQLLEWADVYVRENWWSAELGKKGRNIRITRKQLLAAVVAFALVLTGFVYINLSGNSQPAKLYVERGTLVENRKAVKDGTGKWGFVDEQDKEIVKPQYDRVTPYSGGFAVVQQGCCTCGYINKAGVLIGSLNHRLCEQAQNGKAKVEEQDGVTRIIDLK